MGRIGAGYSVSFVIAMATSCGGKSSSPSAPTQVPLSQAPQVALSAYCRGYEQCFRSQGFSFDASACERNVAPVYTEDSICPPTSTYDPVAALLCYQQMEAALSECTQQLPFDSPCYTMCTGARAVGSSCTASADCAPPDGGHANCSSSGNVAICMTTTHVKAGDSCNATCIQFDGGYTLCASNTSVANSYLPPPALSGCIKNEGLQCPTLGICQSTIPIGGACENDTECQLGAHCEQTCVANLALGSACTSSSQCADGAYCGTNQVCIQKKPAGEVCAAFQECEGFCDATGHCVYGPSSELLNVTAASCASPSSR